MPSNVKNHQKAENRIKAMYLLGSSLPRNGSRGPKPNAWAMSDSSDYDFSSNDSGLQKREIIYSYEGYGQVNEAGKATKEAEIKAKVRKWYTERKSLLKPFWHQES